MKNRKERRAAQSKEGKGAAREESLLALATEAAEKMYRSRPVDLRDTVFLFLDVSDEYALYIAASVTSRRDGVPFDDAVAELEKDHRVALGKGKRAVMGFWANGEDLATLLVPDLEDSQTDVKSVLTTPPPDDRIRICAIADGGVAFSMCDTP